MKVLIIESQYKWFFFCAVRKILLSDWFTTLPRTGTTLIQRWSQLTNYDPVSQQALLILRQPNRVIF